MGVPTSGVVKIQLAWRIAQNQNPQHACLLLSHLTGLACAGDPGLHPHRALGQLQWCLCSCMTSSQACLHSKLCTVNMHI